MPAQNYGTTTHFILQYDKALETTAQPLAAALAATVETDLFRLKEYLPFDTTPGKDRLAAHQIVVLMQDTQMDGKSGGPQRGGGFNTGDISTVTGTQTVQIAINPFGANTNAAAPADYVRFVFIAELTEQLMLFHNWPQDTNQSESISRVMAELLYPTQGYDTQNCVSPAPWVNGWLSARATDTTDYLTAILSGELNSTAYGCGILFLNYLQHQLGLSLESICQAAGPTLANRYQQVTGNTDDPMADMIALLNKHFPAGIQLPNNNPFPLYDQPQRQVYLQFAPETAHSTRGLPGVAHVSPFFTCPAKDYQFWWMRSNVTEKITATTLGFGYPEFQWQVGVFPIYTPASSGSTPTTAEVPDPNNPNKPTPIAGNITFNYSHSETGTSTDRTSTLQVTNTSFEGDYAVGISVSVTESVDDGKNAVTASQSCDFDALWVLYDAQYTEDQKACEDAFRRRIESVPRLEQMINIIKTLPDPPAEQTLARAIEALLAIERLVQGLAHSDPALAANVARYAAQRLGVPDGTFQQARPAEIE